MPNWCNNILVISGEPELTEEFRIIHAQHTEQLENEDLTKSLTNDNSEPKVLQALVRHRYPNDLSFAALVRGWDEDVWGTNRDVAGDTSHERHDKGGWRIAIEEAVQMDRMQSWSFNTEWNPPSTWLECVAPKFPDLIFNLGYSEPGMSRYGHIQAHGSLWNDQSQSISASSGSIPKPLEQAMTSARRTMPMHRKPSKLLRAVWNDDEQTIGSMLRQHQILSPNNAVAAIDKRIESPWTALMHAAYAGSEKVGKLLIQAGASVNPPTSIPGTLRIGFADICLDINGEMPERLVNARMSVYKAALAAHPDMSHMPLVSGRLPLALALRYQMGELIELLLPHSPGIIADMAASGKNAHDSPALVVHGLTKGLDASALGRLLDRMPREGAKRFGRSLVEPLLACTLTRWNDSMQDSAAVLFELSTRGCIDPHHWRMALGEQPVQQSGVSQRYVSDDFRALASAIRARAVMAEIANGCRAAQP